MIDFKGMIPFLNACSPTSSLDQSRIFFYSPEHTEETACPKRIEEQDFVPNRVGEGERVRSARKQV